MQFIFLDLNHQPTDVSYCSIYNVKAQPILSDSVILPDSFVGNKLKIAKDELGRLESLRNVHVQVIGKTLNMKGTTTTISYETLAHRTPYLNERLAVHVKQVRIMR